MCHVLTVGLLTAVTLAFAGSAVAITPAQKCAAAKLKEAGKYVFCRAKAEAKAVRSGADADFERCDEKLLSSWSAIETDGGVSCPTLGDGTAIQDIGTRDSTEVARKIHPAASCLDAPAVCVDKTLWVAPGALGGIDVDCASADFATIQDAIDAAATANALTAGSVTTINVCPGTYDESPRIDVPNLAIRGVGAEAAIIQPTTPRVGVVQRAPNDAIVAVTPIVWVTEMAAGTSLSHLVISGGALLGSAIGIYFDYGNGAVLTGTVEDVVVTHCAPTGIEVASTQSGPAGSANVSVTGSVITGSYDGGINCVGGDSVVCTVSDNTLSNEGAGYGVALTKGAAGSIKNNRIVGGSGIRLLAAGYRYGSPVTLNPIEVSHNVLALSQVGISIALSAAVVSDNTITTAGTSSIGIYGVGASSELVPGPFYSIGLNFPDAVPADQPITVSDNRIVCGGDVATAEGIWMGEDWSPGAPWSIAVTAENNYFGPGLDLRIDPGAHL